MKKTMHISRRLLAFLLAAVLCGALLTGCAFWKSRFLDIRGNLVGIGFHVSVYDNMGNNVVNLYGDKVSLENNVVEVISIDENGNEETSYELSSVITSTVDGSDFSQVGNTVIYAEKGLEPVEDFQMNDTITADGGSIALVDRQINKLKNKIGAPKTIIISSQMGVPIAVYAGKSVYYEIPDDLPKMTKLVVDGKALYVHRANYMILDTELLE